MSEPAATPKRAYRLKRFLGGPITISGAVLIVVFLAGVSAGVLALSTWVTPSVELTGTDSSSVTQDSICNGWVPQVSFDGYFHCSVRVWCVGNYGGNFYIGSVTAPKASNVIVSPSTPVNLQCNGAYSTDTIDVSGQLGYSGAVTIVISV